jgi:hypothetical protein
MAKGLRNLIVAAAMTALVLTGGTSGAADREVLTIVLRVTDHAGTHSADLARAQAEIERIYEAIGVRVVWSDMKAGPDPRVCEGFNLFVSLLSPLMVERLSSQGVEEKVLGSASNASGRAFIYSERVRARAARSRVDGRVLLGRVIAHEIGHLVLPGADHSRAGIMTEGIDTDPTGLQARFMPWEARAIRALLESKAVTLEGRGTCGN